MLLAAVCGRAQDMTVKKFEQSKNTTAQSYPRLDLNEKACAVVRVAIKPIPKGEEVIFNGYTIGSIEYREDEGRYWVYMIVGARDLEVNIPSVGKGKVEFRKYGIPSLQSKQTYDLDINSIEPRRTLVMAEGALGASQGAFGVMVGMVQKHGGYLHGRFDFSSAATTLECNDEGIISGGDYDGKKPFFDENAKKKSRFSITGGYICRFAKPIYGFIGAGYGQRTLAWQTTDGEWVKNTDHSASGITAEVGAILRIGKVGLSLSYQTISFKYHEAGLGLGLFF